VLECAPRLEGLWSIKDVFYIRLSLTLGGCQRVVSRDTCFTSEKVAPDIHITGTWGDPWAGLDPLNNKFFLLGINNLFLFVFFPSLIHAIPRNTSYILI
jgi:hypothetical protein